MRKNKRQVQHICNNCRLFNPQENNCKIVILHEGARAHVPVDPQDLCFYESLDGWSGEKFVEDVKEVKFWVENENGEKTDGNGTVKLEYPEGFFGDEEEL